MPLDLTLKRQATLSSRLPDAWKGPLLHLAIAWAMLFVLFAPVFVDMLLQYWDSSTYNHILFVPLIIGWLVKLRAPELAKLAPRAWWPGLVPFAGAMFLWLVADVTGIALGEHLAVVVALQSTVLAILGPRVCAALLFPLLYGLFLVPFGDELVPTLQMITADLTIALTHWSGIPAVIEGVFIDTPAGLFEVAEACSGVKFLIAMIALGTLTAHVCFASWKRRAIFMAVAVVLPILANGVRAWGTIYIAQSQGIEFAAGFDHIFYGWIFFAIVMGLLLALSWRHFDRPRDDSFIDGDALADSALFDAMERTSITGARALLGLAALALVFVAWSAQARQVEAAMPAQIVLPQVEGWQRAPFANTVWWEPRASGADHRLIGSYVNADGARVELFFALYGAQEDGREAGAFGEGALVPDSSWRWHSPGPDLGMGISERLQSGSNLQRLALTTYRHRDLTTSSIAALKLSNMRDRLTFSAEPTMMVIISAVDRGPVPAEAAIADFVESTGDFGAWMDRIAQKP